MTGSAVAILGIGGVVAIILTAISDSAAATPGIGGVDMISTGTATIADSADKTLGILHVGEGNSDSVQFAMMNARLSLCR